MRKARIDLGVQIEDIDLGLLRPDADTRLAQRHVAVGRVRYGDGAEGRFVYVKASLCKADPADLHQYRTAHLSFPHESTTDQFFDEAQFESYRELGYRAGKEAAR